MMIINNTLNADDCTCNILYNCTCTCYINLHVPKLTHTNNQSTTVIVTPLLINFKIFKSNYTITVKTKLYYYYYVSVINYC